MNPSFKGIELFDAEMNFVRQILACNGHKDCARLPNGRDVLVVTNANEGPVTLPDSQNAIVVVDVESLQQRSLLALGWATPGENSNAVHISTSDADLCFVSTYQRPDAPWQPYSSEILRVALDGSGVQRICHHRSTITSYNAQPKVSCSRDGSRFVFASNFGQVDRRPDYCETYLVTLDAAPVPEGKRDAPDAVVGGPIPETKPWRRVPRKEA